uniref:Tyrosine-protein phosphatase domain-containing protein n=1 Tax=Syphacia muris TaxID=451379 RepID=A0A0N5ATN6_9BILA
MISEIMANGANQQQLEAEVRICCVIQVTMWPIENKVPLSTSGLIDIIKMARSWRKRAPDRPETKPTIVMSHNGVSRCGIYIAANVCIDQMNIDHEVDVFHADEYKYLYDLMLHWYMTNPEYRVFDEQRDEQTNDARSGNSSKKSSFRINKAVTESNHIL